MHPTRTTTKLLLGVACAVSAVSGCVNVTPPPVQPAPAPGTPGAPPRHEPRGGPGAAPVVVRAPALEALEAVEALPGRPAGPAPSTSGRAAVPRAGGPAAEAAGNGRAAGRGAPAAAAPVPDIPEPRQHGGQRDHADGRPGGQHPGRPRSEGAEVPRELVRELPVRPADVCALGRRHGRWHPDSPEARICAGVQGG
ncbi:hypothetical protein OG898_25545 [Streptomyces sp. NBC_00193]|uniref:hypothetical protein n=1 Tax=unclassified Streptomyces TaxID=2593676 RepID=UPI002257641F|nr:MULTISPECIES: hypothetical protein [unclassified Streptomyces]MCX5126180.1 hypothetical protein [Streptomyces sp. NBC_00347]MCX5299810.1 hypothetical protein [Streptomyces sp. NBC_00193]